MDNKLAAAIFAAQDAMPDLIKDSTNPHFKNTYISLDRVLETVVPVLREHGLMLTQSPDMFGPNPVLTTRLTLVETGETFESAAPLILERESPQAVGSAITYMRRYSILSILGLVADEDDDGESASEPARKAGASGRRTEVTITGDKKPAF